MRRRFARTLFIILIVGVVAHADDFILDWWTIAGGGDLWATGGDFELSGTIGQPDAGIGMTGGNFALTGGFWAPPGGPPILIGDLSCDGTVGFNDINPFVLRLSNPVAYQAAFPDCPDGNGDINGDGMVSFADINPFVTLLAGAQ